MSDTERKEKMGLPALPLSHNEAEDRSYAPRLEKHLVQRFEIFLTERAQASGRKFVIRHEVGVGRNIADVVMFLLPDNPGPLFSLRLSASESVIVSLLRNAKSLLISEIATSVGQTEKQFLQSIARLIRAGGLIVDGMEIRIADSWPPLKIIAYEAKLTDWREALDQASDYLNFADESYVVLPSAHIVRALSHPELFKERRVGIISVSETGFHIVMDSDGLTNQDWRREFVYSRAILQAGS